MLWAEENDSEQLLNISGTIHHTDRAMERDFSCSPKPLSLKLIWYMLVVTALGRKEKEISMYPDYRYIQIIDKSRLSIYPDNQYI